MPRWLRTVFLSVTLAGVIIRFVLCLRDLATIDNLFVPDDTYYTLSVARSIANGNGPSVDGKTITNGFQPLTAFALVPWFLISRDADAGLRAGIILSALADIASVALIGFFCAKVGGTVAGLFASSLWAASPFAIANALNGLETSLAMCMVLLGAVLWRRPLENPDSRLRYTLGVVWALAVLARIDTAFVILAFGLSHLAQKRFRELTATSFVGLLCLAPWWIYELKHFGTVIPQSGAAVREITEFHRSLYMDIAHQIAWSAGTIVGPPMFVIAWLRASLSDHPAYGIVTIIGYAVVLGRLARWSTRRIDGATLLPVLALILWGIAILLFYMFYLPALWFFSRYLHPVILSITCVFALSVGKLSKEILSGKNMLLFGGVVCVLLFIELAQSVRFCLITPSGSLDGGLAGAKGYRQVAHDVLSLVPRGAIVGSLQSGAIGYYGYGTIRTINLDGVVDREAATAFREDTLGRLAELRGVTHLADWPFNYGVLSAKGGPEMQRARLRILGHTTPQVSESMEVCAVEW